MSAIKGDNIQAPMCFVCACKFPFVASRKRNDINWRQPFHSAGKKDRRIDKFVNLTREEVEYGFGLDQYLEDYGMI